MLDYVASSESLECSSVKSAHRQWRPRYTRPVEHHAHQSPKGRLRLCARAVDRLGPLESIEMYGFEPALVLGDEPSVEQYFAQPLYKPKSSDRRKEIRQGLIQSFEQDSWWSRVFLLFRHSMLRFTHQTSKFTARPLFFFLHRYVAESSAPMGSSATPLVRHRC